MSDELVPVRHCLWLHEAHFIVSVLDVEGIDAVIPDEYVLGVRPELGYALGGVRVLVRASDLDRANETLAAVVFATDANPTSGAVEIRRAAIESDAAVELILALNAELLERYPEPGATHFQLDADEVAPGRGAFLVAFHGERPIGCGAIRMLTPERVEIKRMYVDPGFRDHGIGRRLLNALEAEALALGVREMVLETGTRQGEALALYARAGFVAIEPFGQYVESPFSVCLGKTIAPADMERADG